MVESAIRRLTWFAAMIGMMARYACVMMFSPFERIGPSADTTASICPLDLNALAKASESVSAPWITVMAGMEESEEGILEGFRT